jgi:hypothetical protein
MVGPAICSFGGDSSVFLSVVGTGSRLARRQSDRQWQDLLGVSSEHQFFRAEDEALVFSIHISVDGNFYRSAPFCVTPPGLRKSRARGKIREN